MTTRTKVQLFVIPVVLVLIIRAVFLTGSNRDIAPQPEPNKPDSLSASTPKDSLQDPKKKPPLFKWTNSYSGIKVLPCWDGYMVMDTNNKILLECGTHTPVRNFHQGLAFAKLKSDSLGIFIDTKGRTVVGRRYEDGGIFFRGISIVKRNKKLGCINLQGEQVLPCSFDRIKWYHRGRIWAGDDKGYMLFDSTGRQLHQTKFDAVGIFCNDYCPVLSNKKWGLMHKDGKLVLPCSFEGIHTNAADGLVGVKKAGKWGYWDLEKNALAIAYQFDKAYSFEGDRAVAALKGKYRLIDRQGKALGKTHYTNMGFPNDDRVRICLDDKWGCMDMATGEEIVEPRYDRLWDFFGSVTAVQHQGKYGFINKAGEEVVPCIYADVLLPTHEVDYLTVKDSTGSWSFISKDNRPTAFGKYEKAGAFMQGLVWLDNKHLVSINGDTISSFPYESTMGFSEGLSVVEYNGRCGYVDARGKVVIPFNFLDAYGFSEGFAAVQSTENKLWGYIDKRGEWVIYPQFDEAYSFRNGRATATAADMRYRIEPWY